MRFEKRGVGVVVGRFQVPALTEGHCRLLQRIQAHPKRLVLLGCSSLVGTRRDPMDYLTRTKLFDDRFEILPVWDNPSDQRWSIELDRLLQRLYPHYPVTIYTGRDSLVGRYTGRYPLVEVDLAPGQSGTDVRELVAVRAREDFRAGCIYSAYQRWESLLPCVDIGLVRDSRYVLAGRKEGEDGWRLPGGHIDPTDATDSDAARRELFEETGLTVEGELKYLWSGAISTSKPGNYRTTLFWAPWSFGAPVAGDDLVDVRWVDLEAYESITWADDHLRLIALVKQAVGL